MKKVNELISNQSSDQTTSVGNYSDADRDFINKLFDRLSGIFPAWKNAFDGPEGVRNAKREWLIALVENEITKSDYIDRGLKLARQSNSPFLPSVGQFIEWCKPDPNELKTHIVKRLGNPSKPETVEKALNDMRKFLK